MNIELKNLLEHDSEYTESKFRSKVENEFIQIIFAIMTGKTQRIEHFVDDNVYAKILSRVKQNDDNNRIEFFDEPNVATIDFTGVEEYDDKFVINVRVLFKSYNYYVTKDTRKFISGDKGVRSEKYYDLSFEKIKNAQSLGNARRCTSCGATIDVNINGKCEYCGSIFKLENYDWVITKMERE